MATEKTEYKGIRKRIGTHGDITYEARVRPKGMPEVQKTFDDLKAAVRWQREMLVRTDKGGQVSTRPDRVKIPEVVSWFKQKVPAKPKPQKDEDGNPLLAPVIHGPVRSDSETARLDMIEHDLKDFTVSSLDHDRIDRYMKALLATPIPKKKRKDPKNAHPLYDGDSERFYAASSVRKIYYTLKKIIEAHAAEHDYPLHPRMFSGHDIPEAWAGHKDRRLEGDEETRLLNAAGKSQKNADEWKRAIVILLETGMRAQELLKSTYDNLSLDGRSLFLPAEIVKKTGRGKVRKGKARHIPLSLKAVEAYKEQMKTRKNGEPRIFWQWKDTSSFDKAFKRISTRAGCPEVMPHTLRHEATARLFEKNRLSDIQIMKITGHSSITTIEKYYKYRPQGIAAMLD